MVINFFVLLNILSDNINAAINNAVVINKKASKI